MAWYHYFWYTGKCQNKIKERCIDFLKIPSNVKIKQMISRQQRKWINTRLQISLQWSFLAPHLFLLSQMFSNLYIMVGRKNIAMFDIYFFMVLKITHLWKELIEQYIDSHKILIFWCHCLHQGDIRHKIMQSYCKNWMYRKNYFMIPLGSRILS